MGALAGPGKKDLEAVAVGASGVLATVAGGVVEVAEITAQRRGLFTGRNLSLLVCFWVYPCQTESHDLSK